MHTLAGHRPVEERQVRERVAAHDEQRRERQRADEQQHAQPQGAEQAQHGDAREPGEDQRHGEEPDDDAERMREHAAYDQRHAGDEFGAWIQALQQTVARSQHVGGERVFDGTQQPPRQPFGKGLTMRPRCGDQH